MPSAIKNACRPIDSPALSVDPKWTDQSILVAEPGEKARENETQRSETGPHALRVQAPRDSAGRHRDLPRTRLRSGNAGPDRKRVVSGKSVSVRVDLGGRRPFNQKHTAYHHIYIHIYISI